MTCKRAVPAPGAVADAERERGGFLLPIARRTSALLGPASAEGGRAGGLIVAESSRRARRSSSREASLLGERLPDPGVDLVPKDRPLPHRRMGSESGLRVHGLMIRLNRLTCPSLVAS